MEEPIISVAQGKLLGKTCQNLHGGTFYSFQGIPYAKPPLGQLRFKAPQPPEPWSDIRDARSEGSGCYSKHFLNQTQLVGSEDCLFLNVFTPEINSTHTELKPVMVWIHGGAFTSGSSKSENYGPEYLLTEDIILVTINYRLGILGFLSLKDSSLGVPGNAGLKDMVMALKWVQKNIQNFAGDPNNVTIFGESAGGASVHCLVLSPMAKGLFHKAIAQSGCALNNWSKARNISSDLAEILQIANNESEILTALRSMSVEKLFEIGEKISNETLVNKKEQLRAYGPIVEKTSDEEAFLSQEPDDIIKKGTFNHVPFMVGFTNNEGLFLESFRPIKKISDFNVTIPLIFDLKPETDFSRMVANKIKTFYCDNRERFIMFQTDNWFFREIHEATKLHALTSTASIYFYRMSVESELNLFKKLLGCTGQGVCHGDDVGYLFKTIFSPEIKPNSLEDVSVRRFVKLWTNFARCGDPNPKQKDDLINVTWEPVTKDDIHFLDIGPELTVDVNPEADRIAFWDELKKLVESNK